MCMKKVTSQSADLIVPHPLLKYEFEYDLANS